MASMGSGKCRFSVSSRPRRTALIGTATLKAEEPPSAILLAHAAFLSAQKHAQRRAALWYPFAANKLEKCGIVSVFLIPRLEEFTSDCIRNL